MGEIADSLISGEFDCITGEYLGDAVGYPRTYVREARGYVPSFWKETIKQGECMYYQHVQR